MRKVIVIGVVMFLIGTILMVSHYQRVGHPFAHGDSWGLLGALLFVVGLGVAVVGLFEVWRVRR